MATNSWLAELTNQTVQDRFNEFKLNPELCFSPSGSEGPVFTPPCYDDKALNGDQSGQPDTAMFTLTVINNAPFQFYYGPVAAHDVAYPPLITDETLNTMSLLESSITDTSLLASNTKDVALGQFPEPMPSLTTMLSTPIYNSSLVEDCVVDVEPTNKFPYHTLPKKCTDEALYEVAKTLQQDLEPLADSLDITEVPAETKLAPKITHNVVVTKDRGRMIFAIRCLLDMTEPPKDKKDQRCAPRAAVYQAYVKLCETSHTAPLSHLAIGRLLRVIYPDLQAKRLGPRGHSRYQYVGFSLKESGKIDSPEIETAAPSFVGDDTKLQPCNLHKVNLHQSLEFKKLFNRKVYSSCKISILKGDYKTFAKLILARQDLELSIYYSILKTLSSLSVHGVRDQRLAVLKIFCENYAQFFCEICTTAARNTMASLFSRLLAKLLSSASLAIKLSQIVTDKSLIYTLLVQWQLMLPQIKTVLDPADPDSSIWRTILLESFPQFLGQIHSQTHDDKENDGDTIVTKRRKLNKVLTEKNINSTPITKLKPVPIFTSNQEETVLKNLSILNLISFQINKTGRIMVSRFVDFAVAEIVCRFPHVPLKAIVVKVSTVLDRIMLLLKTKTNAASWQVIKSFLDQIAGFYCELFGLQNRLDHLGM